MHKNKDINSANDINAKDIIDTAKNNAIKNNENASNILHENNADDALYRRNVAAVVLSSSYPFECKFFIAERIDLRGIWQFPQGGIDEGESVKEALLRELKEEIGTDNVEIIAQMPRWIKYDFPQNVTQKMKPYKGQVQQYFLVRLKDDDSVNIQTPHPEFNRYEFVGFNELTEKVNKFKKPVYMIVLEYFKEKGYI